MATFCSTCGKPLAPDARFCGGCGTSNSIGVAQSPTAQPVPASAYAPAAAPAKSGSTALKIVVLVVVLGGAAILMAAAGAFYFGRKKIAELRQEHGVAATGLPDSASGASSERHAARSSGDIGAALLSKEEVGAIIGVPVTSIEMTGSSDAHYKTATPVMEAAIEVERKDDEADAIQSIEAARKVTHGFGGKGEKIAGLGDDALYGAFNILYVRKNDVMLTITPPNLQQAAQIAQVTNMTSQPWGSEGQKKALEHLGDTMQGDPAAASLAKPDAASGAVDLIRHSATESGNEYETKARLMARQMAEKVLAKLGN